MKMKKILSSVMALAMAVTTFTSISSIEVCAADDVIVLTAPNCVVDKVEVNVDFTCETNDGSELVDWMYEYLDACFAVNIWSGSADEGAYLKFGCGGTNQEQYYDSFLVYSGTDIVNQTMSLETNLDGVVSYVSMEELGTLTKTLKDDYKDVTSYLTINWLKLYDEEGNVVTTWTAPIEEGVVYAQETAAENGVKAVRFVQMISEADANAAESVTYTITNGTASTEVTSSACYTTIKAGGEELTAPEGYVFVAVALKNVPEAATITGDNATLKCTMTLN